MLLVPLMLMLMLMLLLLLLLLLLSGCTASHCRPYAHTEFQPGTYQTVQQALDHIDRIECGVKCQW